MLRVLLRLSIAYIAVVFAAFLPFASCQAQNGKTATFTLRGTAYQRTIPRRFTCDGAGVSPPLQWSGVPQGARSLVLILKDPDAPRGTFIHWILYNIPPHAGGIPANIAADGLPEDIRVGKGTSGHADYFAPCPPSGTHRYVHTLYALNIRLTNLNHPGKVRLLQAMQGHILGKARLVVPYTRVR